MTLDRKADEAVPTLVYGGHGYAAGEILRLLTGHPKLRVAAIASSSQDGRSVVAAFPHLAGAGYDDLRFTTSAAAPTRLPRGSTAAAFFATPHGATAALVRDALRGAEASDVALRCVDLSADFRFKDAAEYAAIYGAPHGAPELLPSFVCDVPELARGAAPAHATQPGCFTTCVTLSAAPFLASKRVEPEVFASAITGSSGSGGTPTATTHHPERRSNLYAYSPLSHRHEAEMRALLGRVAGGPVAVDFAPHSGPFVRGIHATLRMTLREPADASTLVAEANAFYAASPFVDVSEAPPKLSEVVGTNRCRIGVATRGRTLVVAGVIDNLVKGAAGGAIQWMNRLLGFEEGSGLRLPGLGWV